MSLIPVVKKRLTIKGSLLRNRSRKYKEKLTHNFVGMCMELLESKKLKPAIDSVYHWDDVEERSEEHTSELQSRGHLVCRLLLEKKKPLTHHHRHHDEVDEQYDAPELAA